MHLATDYVHPAPGRGRCRGRVFLPDDPDHDSPVVVCTEPKDNQGRSVTNAAAEIAGEVIENFRLPTPLVWIEHYEDGARGTAADPATFDLVIFSHYEPREVLALDGWRKAIGEPSWKALDRASAEALVGEEL